VARSDFHNKEQCGVIRILNSEALTVYKIDDSDVDGKPEVPFMCLKRLVGERGFEPPTPLVPKIGFTKIQHFSAVCMNSDSLVEMRASAPRPNLQLNAYKRPLGTILGTAVTTKEQVVRPEHGGGVEPWVEPPRWRITIG
jgi:hypothetical protein